MSGSFVYTINDCSGSQGPPLCDCRGCIAMRKFRENIDKILYIPESCLGENYDYTYRNLDVQGKTILEFGAEVGSTASYFLRHGAERVISVEGNGNWYNRLVENAKQMDGRCEPIHLHLSNSADLEKLIKKYKPDILHMDIEGDEKYLLELSDELWDTIPIIDLEVHKDWNMLWEFVSRLFKLCYEINLYTLDPKHDGWVLTAVKMDPKNFLDCKGYAI